MKQINTCGTLGLSRAITQCTQPTSQLSGDVLRALQKYLLDTRGVDAVYYALMDRAVAEPISMSVVTKVVLILKQLLLRYPPSAAVLTTLASFCSQLQSDVTLLPADAKMLHYVAACVLRLQNLDNAQASPAPKSPVRTVGLTRFMRGGFGSAKALPFQPLPTVPSGVLSPGAVTSTSLASPASRLHSARQTGASLSHPPASPYLTTPRSPMEQQGQGDRRTQSGGGGGALLLPYSTGVVPTWAVQPPAMLEELMAPLQAGLPSSHPGRGAGAGVVVDMRWIAHVPEMNPSLTAAPYSTAGRHAQGDESRDDGSKSGPITVSALLSCVLDLSPEEQPRQLEEVAARLRVEAAQAGGDGGAGEVEGGGRGGRAGAARREAGAARVGRKRLLFHHPPYSSMEPLNMSEADMAVVIEVVCGAAAAHALLSGGGEPDGSRGAAAELGYPSAAPGAAASSWEDEFHQGDLGQVCVSILIKLMMDMWMTAGAGNSYILILRMLRKALASPKPQIRSRAFDLLYNMAVHASLFEPPTRPGADSAQDGTQPPQPPQPPTASAAGAPADAQPAASSQPAEDTQHAVTPASGADADAAQAAADAGAGAQADPPQPPNPTAGDAAGTTGNGSTEAAGQGSSASQCNQLRAWIRALLFQLLEDLGQSGEESDSVWQAALGTLLHCCTHGGHWVCALVEALPLSAAAGLLRACLAFRWALDVHCQLLRLAAFLLIQHSDSSAGADRASVADSAAELDVAGSSKGRDSGSLMDGQDTRVGLIPPGFGGLSGVLEALAHAPCPTACLDMLAVLIHFLTPDNETEVMLARVLASRGAPLLAVALQGALRAPRPGMALRLSAALSGVGIGPSPADIAASSGVSGAAATIRALGGTPAPPTTQAGMLPGVGSVTTDGSAVLPPSSAKLVLNMLTLVEAEALKFRHVMQQSPQLNNYLKATITHITPAGGTVSDPQAGLPSNLVTAAWNELKATCSNTSTMSGCMLSMSSAQEQAHAHLLMSSSQASPFSGALGSPALSSAHYAGLMDVSLRRTFRPGGPPSQGGVRRSEEEVRSSMVLMSPPTASCAGRHLALHWLHKVLLQALHVCQSNPLLLTPLNLRTSEAGKLPGSSSSGGGLTPARSVPLASSMESPRRASSWTGHLADVLLHCVREVSGGCRLLVAAMARAVSDIKKGVQETAARQHLVMSAYYITLLWVLQSGDNTTGSDSHLAAQELADYVLEAITQERAPAIDALPAIPSSVSGSVFFRSRSLAATGAHQSWLAAQHLHVSTALVSGHADFAPEPLQATVPELLVALIRCCSQQKTAAGSMLRGLYGRPHRRAGGDGAGLDYRMSTSMPGSGRVTGQGGGDEVQGLPATAWDDVALDRRLALLMALMARCALDPDAFAKYGLSHLVKEALLPSEDARERYYAGVYLLRHWQLNQQDKYWRMLRQLILQAQQLNDDSLLDNPYLTTVHMLSVEGHG